MTWVNEIVFNDPEFTVWQIGNWQFTRMKTGEAFWEFVGEKRWTKKPWSPKPPIPIKKLKPTFLKVKGLL